MSYHPCPLCLSDNTYIYYKASSFLSPAANVKSTSRDFQQCHHCDLIFVPSDQFLSKTEEENQYNLHQNSPDDPGYRNFLSKLYDPMIKLLDTRDCGLDYGSGPGPTLSVMLEERGHTMNIYDYIFAADDCVLENTYDFITCTETIEHFRSPRDELIKIWEMLKAGGYLGVMTSFFSDEINFPEWHYKNDPTHICFYSAETIQWLASFWGASVVYQDKDVVIFQKRKDVTTQ